MQEPTPRLVAILQRYMRDPAARIASHTTLSAVGIDQLDLPMIFLEVEDVFAVEVDYHDAIEDLATAGELAACLASALVAKASQPQARRSIPRKKGNWMSTGAGR